jgi:serine/threonine protein phosphatase PrpC
LAGAVGMVPGLAYGGSSDAGPVRPHNEDCWRAVPEAGLFVVADGMGGYRAGEVAAEIAVDTACRLVPLHAASENPGVALARAFEACNRAILASAAANPDCLGMGTTLVACLLRDGILHVAHVGDSRAYLLRDGQIHRLTRDHSIGQALRDSGAVTESQLRHVPGRGILTRALGVEETVACDVVAYEWAPDDRLLICSDGVTDLLPDDSVARLLLETDAAGPLAQAEALVVAAVHAGGCDNITALVVRAAVPARSSYTGASEAMH